MTIGSALLSVLLIALEAFGKILSPSLVPTQMSSFLSIAAETVPEAANPFFELMSMVLSSEKLSGVFL